MNDRHLFRGKKFGMSKTPYGDGWAIGHLIEAPKVGNHRSGWSIADYTANPPRILYDDVDPATIGQCTGLKDKNGKLIFEGDIIKSTTDNEAPEIYRVAFENYRWELRCPIYDYQELNDFVNDYTVLEVIGNIHDSPDLLKFQLCRR